MSSNNLPNFKTSPGDITQSTLSDDDDIDLLGIVYATQCPPDAAIPWSDAWIDERAKGPAQIKALLEVGKHMPAKYLLPREETVVAPLRGKKYAAQNIGAEEIPAANHLIDDKPVALSDGAINGLGLNNPFTSDGDPIKDPWGYCLSPPMPIFSALPGLFNDTVLSPPSPPAEAPCMLGLYQLPLREGVQDIGPILDAPISLLEPPYTQSPGLHIGSNSQITPRGSPPKKTQLPYPVHGTLTNTPALLPSSTAALKRPRTQTQVPRVRAKRQKCPPAQPVHNYGQGSNPIVLEDSLPTSAAITRPHSAATSVLRASDRLQELIFHPHGEPHNTGPTQKATPTTNSPQIALNSPTASPAPLVKQGRQAAPVDNATLPHSAPIKFRHWTGPRGRS